MQACPSVPRRWWEQQDQEFKASLSYKVELEASLGEGKRIKRQEEREEDRGSFEIGPCSEGYSSEVDRTIQRDTVTYLGS